MSSEKGKKRSKAFYRKSAFGGKRQCTGSNRLESGQKGFLVMCNNNESSAVREAYNILNDYADQMYGQGLSGYGTPADKAPGNATGENPAASSSSESEDSDEDIEKAVKKEVESMKQQPSEERRFQNCATKAKNCVFIRSTVADPVRLAVSIMEDIAEKKVNRARYAARILPVVGTCKAHTPDIEQLARDVLGPVFSAEEGKEAPKSFTVLFKSRNNNTTTCGKTSVIPAVSRAVKEINPSVVFSWSDFEVAILVEVVCTVCCLGVAPRFTRLRKYNLQELVQGQKPEPEGDSGKKKGLDVEVELVFDSKQDADGQKDNNVKSDNLVENNESGQNCQAKEINSVGVEKTKGEEIEVEKTKEEEIVKENDSCPQSDEHNGAVAEANHTVEKIHTENQTSELSEVS